MFAGRDVPARVPPYVDDEAGARNLRERRDQGLGDVVDPVGLEVPQSDVAERPVVGRDRPVVENGVQPAGTGTRQLVRGRPAMRGRLLRTEVLGPGGIIVRYLGRAAGRSIVSATPRIKPSPSREPM